MVDDTSMVGRRVVLTRPAGRNAVLREALEVRGASVVVVSGMSQQPPSDSGHALRAAATDLAEGRYEALAVTSAAAVGPLCEALDGREIPESVLVAAVGPATQGRLTAAGITVDVMPARSTGEDLAEVLPSPTESKEPTGSGVVGAGSAEGEPRVLILRAELGSDTLLDGALRKGWTPTLVAAYSMIPTELNPDQCHQIACADGIVFASGRTAAAILASVPLADLPEVVACIGPVTAQECRKLGVQSPLVAKSPSPGGLVEVLSDALAHR